MSAAPYHLAERGVGVGVLSGLEVEAGLATGRLSAATLSWREGEPGWVALAARPEFAAAVGAFRALVPLPALAFEAAPLLRLDWMAWARTLRAIWGAPRLAFRPPPAPVSLRRAFKWVIVCATLAAPLFYLQLSLLGGVNIDSPSAVPAGLDLGRFAAFFAGFPLVMVAFVFGGACLLHGVLVALGGGQAGFRATVRSVAYVGGAMLALAVLPCGWMLAPLVTLGYLSMALRATHRDATWRTLAALAVAGCGAACVAAAGMALAVWPFLRPMG